MAVCHKAMLAGESNSRGLR